MRTPFHFIKLNVLKQFIHSVLPQSPIPHNTDNHQHVAKDRCQNDETYKNRLKQNKHKVHIVVSYQRGCGIRRQVGGIKIGEIFVNSNKFNIIIVNNENIAVC